MNFSHQVLFGNRQEIESLLTTATKLIQEQKIDSKFKELTFKIRESLDKDLKLSESLSWENLMVVTDGPNPVRVIYLRQNEVILLHKQIAVMGS